MRGGVEGWWWYPFVMRIFSAAPTTTRARIAHFFSFSFRLLCFFWWCWPLKTVGVVFVVLRRTL